jgi:transcriptional regulator with XRE-family HTH domain
MEKPSTALRMRLARKMMHLRQYELAGKLGVAVPTVCQWETSVREPSRGNWQVFEVLCAQKGIEWDENGFPVKSGKEVA